MIAAPRPGRRDKKVDSAPVAPAPACWRARRQVGHDAGEDDQADAVADARAVICSPSHIRNIVPPTSVITQEARKNQPGSAPPRRSAAAEAFEPNRDAEAWKNAMNSVR
jgi:hypothetical protein